MTDLFIQEAFPSGSFWKPWVKQSQQNHRQRFTDTEYDSFDSLHTKHQLALYREVNNSDTKSITLRNIISTNKIEPEALGKVIERTRRLLMPPFAAVDTGFALDVKGMKAKDACSRCSALGLCGRETPYQAGALPLGKP